MEKKELIEIIKEVNATHKSSPITEENLIQEVLEHPMVNNKNIKKSIIRALIRKTKNLYLVNKADIENKNLVKRKNNQGEVQTYYRREKKGNKGRPTNEVVLRTIEICKEVFTEQTFWGSKSAFITCFKDRLLKNGITPPLSNQTINNYMKKAGIEIKSSSLYMKTTEYSNYYGLGESLGSFIQQIRLSSNGNDYTLFNASIKESNSTITKEDFSKCVSAFYKVSTNDNEEVVVETTIPDNSLVHLLFIFNEKGIENYFANQFEDFSLKPKQDFLYFNTHNYCFEIVFELEELETFLSKTFRIIEAIYDYY